MSTGFCYIVFFCGLVIVNIAYTIHGIFIELTLRNMGKYIPTIYKWLII